MCECLCVIKRNQMEQPRHHSLLYFSATTLCCCEMNSMEWQLMWYASNWYELEGDLYWIVQQVYFSRKIRPIQKEKLEILRIYFIRQSITKSITNHILFENCH